MKKFVFLFAALVGFQLSISAEEKDSLIVNLVGNQRTAILLSDVEDIHFSFPGDADRDADEEGITQVIVTTIHNYRFPLSKLENTGVFHPNSKSFLSCPDDNHPHMIDLGLPSGTKWACCNVGASTPEGYGGYYAWGETEEKSVYATETYIWTREWYYTDIAMYAYLAKYCTDSDLGTVDNKTVLDASDDVAQVKWGDGWRMPTYDDQWELLSNTVSELTTVNGINGRKFTGANGGTIFLPAAGGYDVDYPDPEGHPYSYVGRYNDMYSYYWSSSLYYHDFFAHVIYVNTDDIYFLDSCGVRKWGYPVRPVHQ